MTIPVLRSETKRDGAYAVRRPRASDGIMGALQAAYAEQYRLPADMASLLARLDSDD